MNYPAPNPPYIPAKYKGGSQTPTLGVIHSTVGPSKPGSAKAIANYFQSTRVVSSAHYSVDSGPYDQAVYQSVYDSTVAYHCGYNQDSIGVEMCDYPSSTSQARWSTEEHQDLLNNVAHLAAELHLSKGIKVRMLTDAQLLAWDRGGRKLEDGGWATHAQMSRVFKKSTHWDPGQWPASDFIAKTKTWVKKLKAAENTTKPKKRPLKRTFAEVSLQYDDSDKEHTADITKVFSQGYHHILGTEAGAGAGNTAEELKRIAKAKGYKLVICKEYDTWVAVKESLVSSGSWRGGAVHVLDRSEEFKPKPKGRWLAKALVWAKYNDAKLGTISATAFHTLTWGSTGIALKNKTDNQMRDALADWGKKHGAGENLAFAAGDTNRKDAKGQSGFFQKPWVSAFDETGEYPATHKNGPIDGIASYGPDVRVKCKKVEVFRDGAFFLNTDHFLVVATYEIKQL